MMTRFLALPVLFLMACNAGDKDAVDSSDDQDGDGVLAGEDCDDNNADVFPGALELCDGVDNDCDEIVDDADPDVELGSGGTWYLDLDLDGFGDDASPVQACSQPYNAKVDAGDCDGNNARINPEAQEVCDGVDNDCDGKIDGDDDSVDGSTGSAFYADHDGDGYGDPDHLVRRCALADGVSENGEDCDDTDADVSPGAEEIPYNGVDDDCDESSPDDDVDGDGLLAAEDCDDNDAGAYYGLGGSCVSGSSCLDIQNKGYDEGSGVYTIDVDGEGTGEAPFAIACDMETHGGGWSLAVIINSYKVDTHEDWGAGYVNTSALAYSPEDASATSVSVQGWLDLNNFDFTTLRVVAAYDGEQTYSSEPILRSELRISFGDDGYYLYNDSNGYYWCGGDASYTDGGVGQVNQPEGAPSDCKGHSSLGSGWDFSTTGSSVNEGLTLCGGDASTVMSRAYGPAIWAFFDSSPAAAQGVWVR